MKKITCLIIMVSFSFFSCEKSEWYSEGTTFYLKNENAVMPIWVKGNISSGIFIIVNHGGPGFATSLDFHKATSFQQLEEDYAIVYWDQRMSGMSKGDPKVSDLSIELHVEDLSKLVTLINTKYSPNSLFLYGHSWGGALAIAYLGRDDNQQIFNGWIDEDGGLQDRYEMDLRELWTVEKANQKYLETNDESWLQIEEWWNNNPDANEGDAEPFQFVADLGGYIYDEEDANSQHSYTPNERPIHSQYSFSWRSIQYDDTEWLANYDFMPQAQRISIPTLTIWGIEDGAVPIGIGDTLQNLLLTPEQDKYYVNYDRCAHSPHWEKSQDFYVDVSDFIERYK